MIVLGDYANSYLDKAEQVTIVAQESGRYFNTTVYNLSKLLYSVVGISTVNGCKLVLKENDYMAVNFNDFEKKIENAGYSIECYSSGKIRTSIPEE